MVPFPAFWDTPNTPRSKPYVPASSVTKSCGNCLVTALVAATAAGGGFGSAARVAIPGVRAATTHPMGRKYRRAFFLERSPLPRRSARPRRSRLVLIADVTLMKISVTTF
jgi:hypothetical protein